MKKFKFRLTKVIALALVCVFLAVNSFQVDAATSIGGSVKNKLTNMTPAETEIAAKLAKQFAAGIAAGAVVGAAVGFYARLGYEAVTYYLGQEEILVSSLKDINYDPADLEKFDNPKN